MFDSTTLNILSTKFIIGILFFIRILGLMVVGPFFKSPSIITQVKIYISAILAIVITSAFWSEQPSIDFHPWYLILLVIKEFFVGMIIGFSADMVFQAARFAGGLIDFDMGYQAASLFDLESNTPTLIGELKATIALMLFLFIDGHHYLIESLFASARAVPLTYFAITQSTFSLLVKMMATMTIIAIKIAAPVLISLFLTNLALALLARVAPQTNIFILSFTAKIIVGLLVLLVTVPLFVMVTKQALSSFETETMRLILTLNPGRV